MTLLKIAQDFAQKNGLDRNLVYAIIDVETGWQPYKFRFEPLWSRYVTPETFAKNLGISVETEKVLQACSFGVMQIMGATARNRGFTQDLPRLTDPYFGILYGCEQLTWLRKSFKYEGDDLISAYNCGTPRKLDPWTYTNQDYINRVKARIQFYQNDPSYQPPTEGNPNAVDHHPLADYCDDTAHPVGDGSCSGQPDLS